MVGIKMKIAVLSGKGGTGKTLIAVNLAAVAENAVYIDCDVEEPNGHLFFNPDIVQEQEITVGIPEVNENLCDGCRVCVDFCKFNALAFIGTKLITFEELCHSCGGCMLLCPKKALSEKERVIGKIQKGVSENVFVKSGFLSPGEVSGVPIINELLREMKDSNDAPVFIDCPPGSACTVMESIKDADYCLLVVEPTVFGVQNFILVFELVKLFKKPFSVILNKCTQDKNPAEVYCLENGIKILEKIPFDKELGKLNAEGQIVTRKSDGYKKLFSSLLQKVIKEVQHETAINP
jgi:MinD superfamily P-loop ATPase